MCTTHATGGWAALTVQDSAPRSRSQSASPSLSTLSFFSTFLFTSPNSFLNFRQTHLFYSKRACLPHLSFLVSPCLCVCVYSFFACPCVFSYLFLLSSQSPQLPSLSLLSFQYQPRSGCSHVSSSSHRCPCACSSSSSLRTPQTHLGLRGVTRDCDEILLVT